MDIRDLEAGAPRDYFWFRAKAELIGVLLGKLGLEGRPRILDIGAGTGDDLRVISRFGEVTALEPDEKSLALIPEELGVRKVLGDVCRLPMEESSVDVALAFDVLEHVRDDSRAADEVRRVLKPGGYFVVSVPAYMWLFGSHDRALGHWRRYNRGTLRELLKGFEVVELGSWMFSLFPLIALQRLLSRGGASVAVRYPKLPKAVNEAFYRMLRLENRAIGRGYGFPFGSTVYCICRKHKG